MASQSERARMDHIVSEFFSKSLLIILGSRIPTPVRLFGSTTGVQASSSRWFNMDLDTSQTVLDLAEPWRRGTAEPMIVDVLLQQPGSGSEPPSPTVRGSFPSGPLPDKGPHNPLGTSTLLERWVIQYERRQESSGPGSLEGLGEAGDDHSRPGNYNITAPVVYKRTVILLRSLYAMTRLLPAHRLYRLVNANPQQGKGGFSLTYRVSSAAAPIAESDTRSMSTSRLSPVEMPSGRLSLSITYRHTTAVAALEVGPFILPPIIADYIVSPTTDPGGRYSPVPNAAPPSRSSFLKDILTKDESKRRVLNEAGRSREEQMALVQEARDRADTKLAQPGNHESHSAKVSALKVEELNFQLIEKTEELAEARERAARMQEERDTALSANDDGRQELARVAREYLDLQVEATEQRVLLKFYQGGVRLRGLERSSVGSSPRHGDQSEPSGDDSEGLAFRSRKGTPSSDDATAAKMARNQAHPFISTESIVGSSFAGSSQKEATGEKPAGTLPLTLSQADLIRLFHAAEAGGQFYNPMSRNSTKRALFPTGSPSLGLQNPFYSRRHSDPSSRMQQEDGSPKASGSEAEESARRSERHLIAARNGEEELADTEWRQRNEQAAASPTNAGFYFPDDVQDSGVENKPEPRVEHPSARISRQSSPERQRCSVVPDSARFYDFPSRHQTSSYQSSPRSQHSAPVPPTPYSYSPSFSGSSNSSPTWHHQDQASHMHHSLSLPEDIGHGESSQPFPRTRSNSGASSPDEYPQQAPYASKETLSSMLKRGPSQTTQQPASGSLDTPKSILDSYDVTPSSRGRPRANPHAQAQSGRTPSSSSPPSSQRPVQAATKTRQRSRGSSPVGVQMKRSLAFDEFGGLARNSSIEGPPHGRSSSAAGSDGEDIFVIDEWFPSGAAPQQLDGRLLTPGVPQPVSQPGGTGTVQGSPGRDWSCRWGYDVFISHAGEDKSFASQLHDCFKRVGLEAFLDEEHLHGGDSADLKMLLAVQEAPIGLVLMGKTFFSKSWPMNELKEIVEKRTLLPILYKLSYEEVEKLLQDFSEFGPVDASPRPLSMKSVLRTTMVTNPSTKKSEAPFLEHIVVEALRRFFEHVCPKMVNDCKDRIWAERVLLKLERACHAVIKEESEFHELSIKMSREVKAWEQALKETRKKL